MIPAPDAAARNPVYGVRRALDPQVMKQPVRMRRRDRRKRPVAGGRHLRLRPGDSRRGSPGQDEADGVGAEGGVLELAPPVHLSEHWPVARGRDAQPLFYGAHRTRCGQGRAREVVPWHLEPGFGKPQLLGLQRHDRGAPQPGRQQQQQRTVALAGEIAATGICQPDECCRVRSGRAGPARRGAAGFTQDGPHARRVPGQSEATLAMLMVDGGQPPGQGGATGTGSGEEGGNKFRAGRQRRHAALSAVGLEVHPIAGVEAQRLGGELAFDGAGPCGRWRRRAVEHRGGSEWVGCRPVFSRGFCRCLQIRQFTFPAVRRHLKGLWFDLGANERSDLAGAGRVGMTPHEKISIMVAGTQPERSCRPAR